MRPGVDYHIYPMHPGFPGLSQIDCTLINPKGGEIILPPSHYTQQHTSTGQ